jgi:hypothetical protein
MLFKPMVLKTAQSRLLFFKYFKFHNHIKQELGLELCGVNHSAYNYIFLIFSIYKWHSNNKQYEHSFIKHTFNLLHT